jgi:hypothetical protein
MSDWDEFKQTAKDFDFDLILESGPETIRAAGVFTNEMGDLVLFDEHDRPIDLFATGFWKRCTMRER